MTLLKFCSYAFEIHCRCTLKGNVAKHYLHFRNVFDYYVFYLFLEKCSYFFFNKLSLKILQILHLIESRN